MIENGHWTLDENGVRGGIEKFREGRYRREIQPLPYYKNLVNYKVEA
jgi:hypothetical protein